EDQRDLAGATVDAVAPVRLVLVEDLLAQVAAGALELQEQVHGVAVAQPHVHVLREGGELAAVVAERLERYRAPLEVQGVAPEAHDLALREVLPQPGRAEDGGGGRTPGARLALSLHASRRRAARGRPVRARVGRGARHQLGSVEE